MPRSARNINSKIYKIRTIHHTTQRMDEDEALVTPMRMRRTTKLEESASENLLLN